MKRASAGVLARHQIANRSTSPALQAMAAHANGSVLLGAGDVRAALVELRAAARAFASAFVESAPQAVRAIKHTLRRDVADQVRSILDHELAEQTRLRRTKDFREGVRASSERRPPKFTGE